MNAQAAYADWSVWSAPLVELQQINQAASEKVTRECISYFSDLSATAVRAMQTLPRITNAEDFVATQMKMLTQQGEKNLEFMQNIFQIYQNVMKDHCQWTEEKVTSAIKTAGAKVKEFKKSAEEGQH